MINWNGSFIPLRDDQFTKWELHIFVLAFIISFLISTSIQLIGIFKQHFSLTLTNAILMTSDVIIMFIYFQLHFLFAQNCPFYHFICMTIIFNIILTIFAYVFVVWIKVIEILTKRKSLDKRWFVNLKMNPTRCQQLATTPPVYNILNCKHKCPD